MKVDITMSVLGTFSDVETDAINSASELIIDGNVLRLLMTQVRY